jgi:hypothetical protein
MAICIPPLDRAESQSRAELRLFAALGDQLGPDWTILHSVAWISKPSGSGPRDGESDLLILHPAQGALVVEVKGGRISLDYRRNRWTSTDRGGVEHEIKNPFQQARNSKYSLLEKLRESRSWTRLGIRRFNLGHAAFMPDVQNARALRGPDAPPEIIGDGSDMETLAAWVRGALDHWAGGAVGGLDELGARGVDAIVATFARVATTRALMSARIRSEDARRIELTERQAGVLDMLRRQRRVMIAGGAGTGKTLLAREKAVRLANEGMRTLLVCFNRGLADHLREQCADVAGLDVATFHQVCHRWIERARAETGEDALADAWREHPNANEHDQVMPLALANAICGLGPLYDAVVVDEAQDFGDEYWMPIEMLLNDLEASMLYVFLDENQDVYLRSGQIPIPGEPLVLDRNCRTSAAIHRAAYRHYRGSEVLPSDIEGVAVETVFAAGVDRQARSVAALITRLVAEERVAPHDIAVLICDSGARISCEKALSTLPIPAVATLGRLEDYREGSLTVDTVRRFKGLERSVVILWGFEETDPDRDRETIYVGMSRATSALYLIGSRGACERLLGSQAHTA